MNFPKLAIVCLAVAAPALACQVALAQDTVATDNSNAGAEMSTSQQFDQLDANRDNVLSRSEVPASMTDLRTHFKDFDADHDLRISYSEFVTYMGSFGTKLAARMSHKALGGETTAQQGRMTPDQSNALMNFRMKGERGHNN